MSEKKKGFLIYLCFGAVVAAALVLLKWESGYSVVHLLCDGFFVAAVLLLGFGGLKYARNQGIFDMMSYSLKTVFQIHYPFTKMNSPLEERTEGFADYKERKRSVRKSPGELLWAGLVYLVLAVIMLVVYLATAGV